MPLVWAHAEFVKLAISRDVGHAVERPQAVWERYGGRRAKGEVRNLVPPCGDRPGRRAPDHGRVPRHALVRWTIDGWETVTDSHTRDIEFGLHVIELEALAFAEDFARSTSPSSGATHWSGRVRIFG